MHDGQPLAGKIRSAWEGIRDQRPEACGKPAKSSHARTHFIAAACCAKGLK